MGRVVSHDMKIAIAAQPLFNGESLPHTARCQKINAYMCAYMGEEKGRMELRFGGTSIVETVACTRERARNA